jgi:transcriptional regulator with XRE-family HTH domain
MPVKTAKQFGSKNPSPVDVYVGARIRQRRMQLGLSQEALGLACRLTFQQIQKYEKGANRVSASRLAQIANALKTTPAYFFKDAPGSSGNGDNGDTAHAVAYAKFIGEGGMKIMDHWFAISTAERGAFGELLKLVALRAKR